MEGMVEENGGGSSDPLSPSPPPPHPQTVTVTSVPSVIHSNQQSVIQTATGSIQATSAVLTKGNVILVSKQPPNSVIQTTQGQLQTLQVVDPGSDDSLSAEDDIKRKRRDILTRRPSYRKILNDLRGAGGKVESSGSECDDSNLDSELSSHSLSTHYQAVIPANAIQISSQGGEHQGLSTITMTNASSTGGAIVQYSQDGQFFVPSEIVVTQNSPTLSSSPILGTGEDQMRKREMRLMKNREAAKECRRKKKEYIKCLENRVAILENQNKALIDELKTLKELYCQQEME